MGDDTELQALLNTPSDFATAGGDAEEPYHAEDVGEYQPIGDTFSVLAAGLGKGVTQIQDSSHAGWLANSDMDDSERLSLLKDGPMKAYMDANGKVDAAKYEQAPWAVQLASRIGSSLPAMGVSIGTGAAAATSAKVLQTPLVSLTSRIPVVGGPLSMVAGAALGGAAFYEGSMAANWWMFYGDSYKTLREAGGSHETSKAIATAISGMQAGAESLISLPFLKQLAGKAVGAGIKEEITKRMANPFVQQVTKNAVSRLALPYAGEVASEGGVNGLQQALEETSKFWLAYAENRPVDFDWATFSKNSTDAALEGMLQAAVLGAGVAGGGYAVGKTSGAVMDMKTVQKMINDPQVAEFISKSSPASLIRSARKALEEQKAAWEDDGSISVNVDDAGKVLITTGVSESGGAPFSMSSGATPVDSTVPVGAPNAPTLFTPAPTEASSTTPATTAPADAPATTVPADAPATVDDALDTIFQEAPITEAALSAKKGNTVELDFMSPPTDLTPVEVQARNNHLSSVLRAIKREENRLAQDWHVRVKTGRPAEKLAAKLDALAKAKEELLFEQHLLDSGALSQEDVSSDSGTLRMSQISRLVQKIKEAGDRLDRRIAKNKERIAIADQTLRDTKAAAKTKLAEGKAKAKQQGLDQGIKQGRRDERAGIQLMRNQLTQFVNSQVKNPQARAALHKYISKVTTKAQFDKQAQVVMNNIDKFNRQRSEARIRKVAERIIANIDRSINASKIRLQSGKPVSNLDADTTARLQKLKGYLEAGDTATADALNTLLDTQDLMSGATYRELMDMGSHHLIPVEALGDIQLMSMAIGLRNQDIMTLRVIEGNIAQWVMDARDAIRAKRDDLIQQRQDELDAAKSSLGVKDVSRVGSPTKKQEATINRNALAAEGLTWNRLMEFVTPNDKNHILQTMLNPTASRDLFYKNHGVQMMLAQDALAKAVKAAGYAKPLAIKINEDSNTNLQLTYRDAFGNVRGKKGDEVQFSKAQLIDIYMKMQDETLRPTMRLADPEGKKGNAWTFKGEAPSGQSFQEVVESALTPTDIAVAHALLKYYDTYHSRVNAWYREKYGVDLPKRDNYSPLKRDTAGVTPGTRQYHNLLYSSMLPGSAKTRVDSLKRIQPQSAYYLLDGHVKDWEHAIAFDDLLGTMRNVFGDALVQQHLIDNYGDHTKTLIDEYINRFIVDEPMSRLDDGILAAWRGDMSTAVLAFKGPYQLLQQLTAGTAMPDDYSVGELLGAYKDYIANIKTTEQAMRDNATLKHRFKEGASIDLKHAMQSNGVFFKVLEKYFGLEAPDATPEQIALLQNIMFAGIRYGDAGVARVFGGAVYHAELRRGATPEQAMLKVVDAMENTQQSDSVEQIPSMWARHPALYTMLGQFRLQAEQIAGKIFIAHRDLINAHRDPNATAKDKAKATALWAKRMTLYYVIPVTLAGALKTLPMWFMPPDDDNDENRARETAKGIAYEAFKQAAGGMPFIEEAAEGIWFFAQQALVGTKENNTAFLGQTKITATVMSAVDAGKALQKAMSLNDGTELPSFDDEEKNAEAWTKAVGKVGRAVGMSTGVPVAAFTIPIALDKALQKGDPVGAALAVSGFAPGLLKNRYGTDKKEAEATHEAESLYDALRSFDVGEAPQQDEETLYFKELLQRLQEQDANIENTPLQNEDDDLEP